MSEQELSKGERTQAALVEAAYHEFVTNGYHGTSMRQIAEAAGLAVGGIYNHFASKEAVFLAVIRERHPLLRAAPLLERAQGETVADLLHDAARRIMAELDASPELLNLMFIELVEFESKHLPELAAVFAPQAFRFLQRLNAARGPLRPVPAFTVARGFIGLIFSYYITARLLANTPLPVNDPTALDDLVDIFLYGVLGQEHLVETNKTESQG